MPIIDGQGYSEHNIQYILELIPKLTDDEDIFKRSKFNFFNIYLGDTFFRFQEGFGPSHILTQKDYGVLGVVLHEIERKFVQTDPYHHAEHMDSCLTVFWTSGKPEPYQAKDALEYTDKVCRAIEQVTGMPLVISVGDFQAPTNFEFASLDLATGEITRAAFTDAREHVPTLSSNIAPRLYAVMGMDDHFNQLIEDKGIKFIQTAANWQQRAIRALGSNQWSDAIISCSVWSETFTASLTVRLLELSDECQQDVRRLTRNGIPAFLSNYLGSRFIKGNWDFSNPTSIPHAWNEDCLKIRNKIMHAGYVASREEAFKCYDTTHSFVRLITIKAGRLKDARLQTLTSFLQGMIAED